MQELNHEIINDDFTVELKHVGLFAHCKKKDLGRNYQDVRKDYELHLEKKNRQKDEKRKVERAEKIQYITERLCTDSDSELMSMFELPLNTAYFCKIQLKTQEDFEKFILSIEKTLE